MRLRNIRLRNKSHAKIFSLSVTLLKPTAWRSLSELSFIRAIINGGSILFMIKAKQGSNVSVTQSKQQGGIKKTERPLLFYFANECLKNS